MTVSFIRDRIGPAHHIIVLLDPVASVAFFDTTIFVRCLTDPQRGVVDTARTAAVSGTGTLQTAAAQLGHRRRTTTRDDRGDTGALPHRLVAYGQVREQLSGCHTVGGRGDRGTSASCNRCPTAKCTHANVSAR